MAMIKCSVCGGTGELLLRNGIDFTFSPGLASTMGAKCPECHGIGKVWMREFWDYTAPPEPKH